MWHIVIIGYLFVAVMFSAAQPSIVRALIYLLFWAVLPMGLLSWMTVVRRRNRLLKQAEQTEVATLSADQPQSSAPVSQHEAKK